MQSNGIKIKVINLSTHINMRNKVKKANNFENYHYENYEEIFGYFLLKKKVDIFHVSLNKS